MGDQESIERVLSGDTDLFSNLVRKYQSRIFSLCMGFVHQKEDADDLSQEVFIKAYQSLRSYRGDASFSTWIYRIAINIALNYVKNKSKKNIFQRIDDLMSSTGKSNTLQTVSMDTADPEQILIDTQKREMVNNALNSLPENQKIAIVLSKYDDLPQKEIAIIMNTTEGAVEALLQRAKVNLREKLSDLNKKNQNHRRKN